jgi:hypothetical protein
LHPFTILEQCFKGQSEYYLYAGVIAISLILIIIYIIQRTMNDWELNNW